MSVRLRPPRGLDLRLPRRNNQSHTVRFRVCLATEAHGTPVKSWGYNDGTVDSYRHRGRPSRRRHAIRLSQRDIDGLLLC